MDFWWSWMHVLLPQQNSLRIETLRIETAGPTVPSPGRKTSMVKDAALYMRPISPIKLAVLWELLWHFLWHIIQFWTLPEPGDHEKVTHQRLEKNLTGGLCLFGFALPSYRLIRGEQNNHFPLSHSTKPLYFQIFLTTGPPPALWHWWEANGSYWEKASISQRGMGGSWCCELNEMGGRVIQSSEGDWFPESRNKRVRRFLQMENKPNILDRGWWSISLHPEHLDDRSFDLWENSCVRTSHRITEVAKMASLIFLVPCWLSLMGIVNSSIDISSSWQCQCSWASHMAAQGSERERESVSRLRQKLQGFLWPSPRSP